MVYVCQSGYFCVISVVSSLCCACRHLPQSVYCSETAWQHLYNSDIQMHMHLKPVFAVGISKWRTQKSGMIGLQYYDERILTV